MKRLRSASAPCEAWALVKQSPFCFHQLETEEEELAEGPSAVEAIGDDGRPLPTVPSGALNAQDSIQILPEPQFIKSRTTELLGLLPFSGFEAIVTPGDAVP